MFDNMQISVVGGQQEEMKSEDSEEDKEEEVKAEEEVVEEESPAPAITEEDVRRIVEEMVMGFKAEIETLKSENVELSSQVVTLSKTPVAAPIATAPVQMSAHSSVLDMIKRRK